MTYTAVSAVGQRVCVISDFGMRGCVARLLAQGAFLFVEMDGRKTPREYAVFPSAAVVLEEEADRILALEALER